MPFGGLFIVSNKVGLPVKDLITVIAFVLHIFMETLDVNFHRIIVL